MQIEIMAKQKPHMNHRRTNKEEQQQRNRLGTVSSKPTGWSGGGVGVGGDVG